MVGTERRHRNEFMLNWCSVYSWWQPSRSFCLELATLPAAFLVYVRYYVRYSYEPCANREFPLSRLPYLKNRMAAIVISTAVPRYWVSLLLQYVRKGAMARATNASSELAHW